MPLRLLPRGCCAGWFGRGVTLDRFDRHRPFAGHEHRVELGGQLLNTAQPVCANGGGRFAGKVRRPSLGVTPGGSRRAGPTEKRPFEVRAPSGTRGVTPEHRSTRLSSRGVTPEGSFTPLVFDRQSLASKRYRFGVHERFGGGNPKELFNVRRSGLGWIEGRPLA
jgi:hypothetical protein